MSRINPDVDIVNDILLAVIAAHPMSEFAKSLHHQYQERGGLSKKQLEGLYSKASKVSTIPAAKIATLEALIKKKPTRYKSAIPLNKPLYEKDAETGVMIDRILEKYPTHKMVVFLHTKFNNDEPLTPSEQTELKKLFKLLL